MKIALVEFNLGYLSGAPRFALNVANTLQKNGHRVIVFTSEFQKENFPELSKHLDIRVVPSEIPDKDLRGAPTLFGKMKQRFQRNRISLRNAKKIAQTMDSDFDLLLCHNTYAYRVGYFYRRKNSSTKIFWIMHDPPWTYRPAGKFLYDLPRELISWIEEKAEKCYYSVMQGVAVLDERNRKIAERFNLPVYIIRGGLDFEKLYLPVRDISRKKYFRILGVGALNPYRRYEDIISAVSILQKQGIGARAVLVCKLSPNTETYQKFLLDLAEKENIREYVDFHFEGASEEELRGIYRESDFYVFPNVIQIWGMAAFEAMAAGLPLVVSWATSVAEVLTDGRNSLLTEPGNPRDIAEKIKFLIEHPELYREIALAGQEFVKNNLTWEKYVENLLQVISPP